MHHKNVMQLLSTREIEWMKNKGLNGISNKMAISKVNYTQKFREIQTEMIPLESE